MMRVHFDEPRPLTAHILLTTDCNFNCEDCFYKREERREIPPEKLSWLLNDLAEGGVKSVAFGGGEPTLYSYLDAAIMEAKDLGMYVAVTTNGAIKHDFRTPPDRLHISYSAMHNKAIRESLGIVIPFVHIRDMIDYYRRQGITVGINYIYENFHHFGFIDRVLARKASTITILLKKPVQPQNLEELYDYIQRDRERFWLDACLVKLAKGVSCRQGTSSFSIDQDLMAHRCSNTEQKVPYTTLKETWEQIKGFDDCIISD